MATEVLPGLWRIPIRMAGFSFTTAYLLVDDDNLVLVDTGLPKRTRVLLNSVARLGKRPFDIRHILITHHHVDHAGSLAALVDPTEARIYVHPLDAPIVRGDEPVPGPSHDSFGARVMGGIASRLMPKRLPHVSIGHELSDGEELDLAGGLRVIHTPGHTPGHVSLLWRRYGGVLVVGDAAFHFGRRLRTPDRAYTEDMDEAKRSIAKLAGLDFRAAVFGHGPPVKKQAVTKFRKLAERLAN